MFLKEDENRDFLGACIYVHLRDLEEEVQLLALSYYAWLHRFKCTSHVLNSNLDCNLVIGGMSGKEYGGGDSMTQSDPDRLRPCSNQNRTRDK